jgi:cytochrome b6-f complex iron-sulfur subunit
MSCQNCLNRRDFLAKSAIAAAALLAAEGCGDGQFGPKPVAIGSGITITLADFAGLATTGTLVDVGHERGVVRTSATTFLAHSKICTHEGCETDVSNNQFQCPCHGSIFAADGSVIRGPSTGQMIGPLQVLATTYDPTAGTLTIS